MRENRVNGFCPAINGVSQGHPKNSYYMLMIIDRRKQAWATSFYSLFSCVLGDQRLLGGRAGRGSHLILNAGISKSVWKPEMKELTE